MDGQMKSSHFDVGSASRSLVLVRHLLLSEDKLQVACLRLDFTQGMHYFLKRTMHLSPGDKVCNVLGIVDARWEHFSKVGNEGAKLIRECAPEIVIEEDEVNQPVVQDHRLLGGDQD